MPARLARLLVLIYPRELRRTHGAEMTLALTLDLARRRGVIGRLRWMVDVVADARDSRRSPRATPIRSVVGLGLPADFRSAFRLFAQAPVFSGGAVLTLALGIGATTAIVSIADATLLHPLDLRDVDRIQVVNGSWSYPDFRDVAVQQTTMTDVTAWAGIEVGLAYGGETQALSATVASARYGALVDLRPAAGRVIGDDDDRDASPLAVMISDALWERLFDRRPTALGSTVHLNDVAGIIVGVLPSGFRGTSLDRTVDLLLPLAWISRVGTGFFARPETQTSRTTTYLSLAGRLVDGGTAAEAEAELNAIYGRLHAERERRPDEVHRLVPIAIHAAGLSDSSDLRTFVGVLLSATAVMLLLASATVANLLLVRAERREREMAIRVAVGAGRGRLARLLLVESVVIGAAGSLGGLFVFRIAVAVLGSFSLPGAIRVGGLELSLNTQVFVVAVLLGLSTSLLFSLAPMWRAARLPLVTALRGSLGGAPRRPLQATLVAVQVALCVVLLGGGLAFGRAVADALAVDLGFDSETTANVAVRSALVRRSTAAMLDYQQRAVDAVRQLPTTRAAGWALMHPLGGRVTFTLRAPGYVPAQPSDSEIDANVIAPGYLDAMGIRLVAGRDFGAGDRADSARVGIVSESLARRFWPGDRALGSLFHTGRSAQPGDPIIVVGVVSDIRRGLEDSLDPMVYVPFTQTPLGLALGSMTLVVAARDVPAADAASVAASTLRRMDGGMPVSTVRTMREEIGRAAMVPRLGFALFALFAALAVVLTACGIYAVVACAMAQRRREVGIRVALGAHAGSVVALVVRQGVRPILIGAVGGAASFWLTGRTLGAFLLSRPAMDLTSIAGMAAGIAVIATVALVGPTRRALLIDPATTLRGE